MPDINETLSSNSLFHFTGSADYLISILKNGISPRYCLENFGMFDFGTPENSEDLELAVPMVCFCDIPLSKVKHHLSFYGNYGIALSKDWGISKGVSPLLYIDSKSETTKSIQDAIYYFLNRDTTADPYRKLIDLIKIAENEADSESLGNIQRVVNEIVNKNNNNAASITATYQKLLRLVRFTKPYKGKFWRKGKYLDEIVRFYDEREWRYVPDIGIGQNNLFPWILKEEFLKDMNRSALNDRLAQYYPLRFEPDDIRYIIIEKDQDIVDTVEYIENSLADRYEKRDIKKVIARILTKEQIQDDF